MTATLSEFPTPVSNPSALITGTDGNLWVLANGDAGKGSVSVVAPDGSLLHTYPIPTADAGAVSLTVGPDGNVWFTETSADKIGKITPTGTITEYSVPNATGGNASVDTTSPSGPAGVQASPTGIVAGADGALWFTDSSSDAIGRITTGGAVTQFPTPGLQPNSIATGPDGAIWFTDNSYNNTIDRLSLDGHGNATISKFSLPENFVIPTCLTTGPDGALWFAESASDAVGRITTGGLVTEFPILGNLSSPQGLTFDAAGNLWIDGYGSGLARLTPQGQTLIVGLQPPSEIVTAGITTGPGGAIWFTDATNNLVGRVDPTTATTLPTDNTLGADPQQNGLTVSEGTLTFTDSLAYFTAGNPSAAPSDFTAQVSWGDGTTSVGTVALSGPGQFNVTGTHTYARFGTYAATVTVTDVNPAQTPQPNALTLATTVDVSNPPVPVVTPVGLPVTTGAGVPGSTTQSGGPVVSAGKVTPPAVPGAHSAGGKGTSVGVKTGPAMPDVSGPTTAELFRAGFINPWFTAARQFKAESMVIASARPHHAENVAKPVHLVKAVVAHHVPTVAKPTTKVIPVAKLGHKTH